MSRTNVPEARPRPIRRIQVLKAADQTHGLHVGAVTSSGGINWAIVPVFGSSSITARIKTATNGGAIDIFPVGPDFDIEQVPRTAYGSLTGTIYTTGNPVQVAVTAGTEAIITHTCKGESYVLIKFTGSVGAGTVTYCDVSTLPIAGR